MGSHPGQSQVERVETRLRELEGRVDRMALLNLALWQLVQEKTGLTEAQLEQRVKELDALDGKSDGRTAAPTVHECPQCHRPLMLHQKRCVYCEYQEPQEGFAAVVR